MTINTIFFHGWGYSPQFWTNFAQSNKGIHSFYNRGYFSEAIKPMIVKEKTIINKAVTHSMGLFFLTQDYNLCDFDDIIIFGGFKKFQNLKALKTMRAKIKTDIHKVLDMFYHQCGYYCELYLEHYQINQSRLEEDLLLLETLDISQLIENISYKAYHGRNDKIVTMPLEKAIIIEDAGHVCNLTL